MLLHGWEGSAESSCVLSLGSLLYSAGYDVLRLNLRDHGGTQRLNREIFHSCRLPEVVGGAFTLDKVLTSSSYYRWCVTTQGDYESVDDMTGPNGFLDAFGVKTGMPFGPKQTSGSYTSSAMYDFTRAE